MLHSFIVIIIPEFLTFTSRSIPTSEAKRAMRMRKMVPRKKIVWKSRKKKMRRKKKKWAKKRRRRRKSKRCQSSSLGRPK